MMAMSGETKKQKSGLREGLVGDWQEQQQHGPFEPSGKKRIQKTGLEPCSEFPGRKVRREVTR